MGGVIGFELTRHLRRTGRPVPRHLFVSAARAPHLPRRGDDIHQLPDAAFVGAVRRMAGTPEKVLQDPELVQLMLPALRADFELVETYRYADGEPLTIPISAFGGVGDDMVDRADLASWAEQTEGPFALRMLPGNHFFLSDAVARPALIQALARELAPLGRPIAGAAPGRLERPRGARPTGSGHPPTTRRSAPKRRANERLVD